MYLLDSVDKDCNILPEDDSCDKDGITMEAHLLGISIAVGVELQEHIPNAYIIDHVIDKLDI